MEIIAVFWLLCGSIAYGLILADLWKKFPELWDVPGEWRRTRNSALMCSLFGPGSLVAGLIVLGIDGQGFMFRWSDPRG